MATWRMARRDHFSTGGPHGPLRGGVRAGVPVRAREHGPYGLVRPGLRGGAHAGARRADGPGMPVRVLASAFEDLLARREVTTVYQPLVHLLSGRVVGYEALARGPAGSAFESPERLFAEARAVGRLGELDWVCRASAYRGALAAGLPTGMSLFVNVEPDALAEPCPPDLQSLVTRAERTLRVVVEMTERHLTADPATLLSAVARARATGWGVAIDEVGRDPASLALMPFVHPDVVRLHAGLVQQPVDERAAAVAGAVMAQAERTGAVVLAEGIETEEHRRRALALGATLGQGWSFGRPAPLPARGRVREVVRLLPAPVVPREPTPFDVVRGRRPTTTATAPVLAALSRHLEEGAHSPGQPPVVLSTFQTAQRFTPSVAARYAALARSGPLVAAMGVGMGAVPAPGVRGTDLDRDDPLAQDWTVLVVGPHTAAGLVARDLGDGGPHRGRRWQFCLTHDRDAVLQSARSLLMRVVPA